MKIAPRYFVESVLFKRKIVGVLLLGVQQNFVWRVWGAELPFIRALACNFIKPTKE